MWSPVVARSWPKWEIRDGGPTLRLIPLTQFKEIPHGTVVTSIMGGEGIVPDIDLDTRGGVLAWGLLEENLSPE